MPGTPQFVDISGWQPTNIDWVSYRKWAASFDGIARVSLKSSEGTGHTDAHYKAYRAGAEASGVDVIIHYHYARPQDNTPESEADWQHQVVGNLSNRPRDILMLDYEENVSQANAQWAYAWLNRQAENYGGRLPTIYASDSYIRSRLQDNRLVRFPLTVAHWTFDPGARPSCPPPWSAYEYLQYTDKATGIPGFPAGTRVDADIYLGAGIASHPTPVAQPQGGSHVSTLKDFPMVSERTSITGDAHPPEDAGLSCVPASILAGVMWLLGKTKMDTTFNPDHFKDKVYGQGYVGGMAAWKYVPYLASQFGINLSSFKGSPASLVKKAHEELKALHPVVFTEPNPYGNPRFTHVCIFYPPLGGMKAGELTAMDPWIAQSITRSDSAWEKLLLDNEIWIMSKIGEEAMVALTIADVKKFFTENADKSWTRIDIAGKPVLDSAEKSVILKGGIKDDWCNHGTSAFADIGLPVDNETQVDPAHPEVVDQQFERCKRRWDPNHVKDHPPHAGKVYSPHIESLYSAEVKLNVALDQLAATQKQLAAAGTGTPSAGASPESA